MLSEASGNVRAQPRTLTGTKLGREWFFAQGKTLILTLHPLPNSLHSHLLRNIAILLTLQLHCHFFSSWSVVLGAFTCSDVLTHLCFLPTHSVLIFQDLEPLFDVGFRGTGVSMCFSSCFVGLVEEFVKVWYTDTSLLQDPCFRNPILVDLDDLQRFWFWSGALTTLHSAFHLAWYVGLSVVVVREPAFYFGWSRYL